MQFAYRTFRNSLVCKLQIAGVFFLSNWLKLECFVSKKNHSSKKKKIERGMLCCMEGEDFLFSLYNFLSIAIKSLVSNRSRMIISVRCSYGSVSSLKMLPNSFFCIIQVLIRVIGLVPEDVLIIWCDDRG